MQLEQVSSIEIVVGRWYVAIGRRTGKRILCHAEHVEGNQPMLIDRRGTFVCSAETVRYTICELPEMGS